MSGRRVLAVGFGALASLVLAGVFGVQALLATTSTRIRTDHLGYGHVQQVRIQTRDGRISVGLSLDGRVHVSRRIAERMQGVDAVATERGGVVDLHGNCGGFVVSRCAVSYQVTVPRGVSVRAWSDSGPVSISGVQGTVDAQAGSGSITVDDVDGDLTAQCGSGSVDVTGVHGDRVRLETGSGHIAAQAVAATTATARTGSGGIDLGLTAVPDRVVAHTGSGHATVLVPGAATYDVHLSTGSGARDDGGLSIATSSPHKIDVDTGSGDARVAPQP